MARMIHDRYGAIGLSGLRIVTDDRLTVPVEDWSDVRSPGRARRRRAKHRQRIRITHAPDRRAYNLPGGMIVMHPVLAAELRERIAEQ